MAIAVRDTFSRRDAHVDEALRILGSSEQKWAIFLAVYRGKKARKNVDDVATATGLSRIQVLNVGRELSRAGLFDQKGRNPVEYVKIEEMAHIRNKIVSARGKRKTRLKTSQKSMDRPAERARNAPPAKVSRAVAGAKNTVPTVEHDVFISHASEDKAKFVRGLAGRLRQESITVWYDEFSLRWGDSLSENIDRGLAASRFGIVVLSPAFFKKPWPRKELDGLVAREVAGKSRILPIWHDLEYEQVAEYSPILAGRLALSSSHPIDDIVSQLKALLW